MLTPEQIADIAKKAGQDAALKLTEEVAKAEANIASKQAEAIKGLMTAEDFNKFKADVLGQVQEKMEAVSRVEQAVIDQGTKLNAALEKSAPGTKSFEDFIIEQGPKLKELRDTGKFQVITASELKAAGISSIGNVLVNQDNVPTNPYAPNLGGADLQLFDIAQNPNYILNHVDLGRTNSPRLAWINELNEDGSPAEVEEGGLKPLIDTQFKVEMSSARKIAAYIKITEEFEDDLPQLATRVRRMLQERVVRYFDDAIQTAVIASATPYNITGMNGDIEDANFWDAVYAMMAQVRVENYIPNTVGINPITNAKMNMAKNVNGTYLLPPFADEINRLKTQANKVIVNHAFVGDLTQFKVDIYKEFVLKMGWVNDDLIRNQFCIVGEMRYHRYISDNRKKAIVYSDLGVVINAIDGTPGS